MSDESKFSVFIKAMTVLVVLVLVYNVFQETFMAGIGDYVRRRLYYENVISKKDLGLHKGMYWKEKQP